MTWTIRRLTCFSALVILLLLAVGAGADSWEAFTPANPITASLTADNSGGAPADQPVAVPDDSWAPSP
jgi:hypothetical protein